MHTIYVFIESFLRISISCSPVAWNWHQYPFQSTRSSLCHGHILRSSGVPKRWKDKPVHPRNRGVLMLNSAERQISKALLDAYGLPSPIEKSLPMGQGFFTGLAQPSPISVPCCNLNAHKWHEVAASMRSCQPRSVDPFPFQPRKRERNGAEERKAASHHPEFGRRRAF